MSVTDLFGGQEQKSHYVALFSEPPTWLMRQKNVLPFAFGLVELHKPWCRSSAENPLQCLLCFAFTLADVAVQCLAPCSICVVLIEVCGREETPLPIRVPMGVLVSSKGFNQFVEATTICCFFGSLSTIPSLGLGSPIGSYGSSARGQC